MAGAEHASQPSYVLAVAIIFMILCPLITILRFHTRVTVNKNASLGLDDWLIIPATLLTIGCAIVLIFGERVGVLAHHGTDNPARDFMYCQQLQWAFLLMHIPSIGCIKLSFVLFFRRIFCVGRWRSPFEIVSALVGVLVVLWNLAFFFWFLFSCSTHFAARWTAPATYLEWCGTDDISDLGLSISDFLTDVIVLALPIPMIWRLHLTLKRKLLILGIFALGLVALIVSTIRMVFFVYVIRTANGGNLGVLDAGAIIAPAEDNNLLTTETLYWSMLEQGLALVACCLPTLNGLFSAPSLRSFIASARSIQSLGSSRRRGQSTEALDEQTGMPRPSGSSTWSGRKNSTATGESNTNPKLAIRVVQKIEQTSNMV